MFNILPEQNIEKLSTYRKHYDEKLVNEVPLNTNLCSLAVFAFYLLTRRRKDVKNPECACVQSNHKLLIGNTYDERGLTNLFAVANFGEVEQGIETSFTTSMDLNHH